MKCKLSFGFFLRGLLLKTIPSNFVFVSFGSHIVWQYKIIIDERTAFDVRSYLIVFALSHVYSFEFRAPDTIFHRLIKIRNVTFE